MFKEGKGSFIFSLHNKEAGDSISINNHPSLIDGVVLTVLHSPPSRMFGTGGLEQADIF